MNGVLSLNGFSAELALNYAAVSLKRYHQLFKLPAPERSALGYRVTAKRWRTGWDYPGGLGLNFPKQRHLKHKRRLRPIFIRRLIYLLKKRVAISPFL